MEDKIKLISSVLDEIESDKEIETDVVLESIADKIRELGFTVAEDENEAEEELTEMGFSSDDFEYNIYDDDCVRECKNPDWYEHPWDWYRFSVHSVSCGDAEIFYVDCDGD